MALSDKQWEILKDIVVALIEAKVLIGTPEEFVAGLRTVTPAIYQACRNADAPAQAGRG